MQKVELSTAKCLYTATVRFLAIEKDKPCLQADITRGSIFRANRLAKSLRDELYEPLQAMLQGAIMDFIFGNDVCNLSRNDFSHVTWLSGSCKLNLKLKPL